MRSSRMPAMGALAAMILTGCGFSVVGTAPVDAGPNAYACTCQCDTAPGDVTASVATSEGDAEELLASGATQLGSTDLELVEEAGPQLVGLRFAGIGVPRGAVILSAHLQFTADEAGAGPIALELRGEASASAAPFAATAGNLSARTRTVAVATWSPPAWAAGDRGPAQRSSDLSAVLQELVDQGAWSPDSAVVLLISGTGRRAAVAFDGNATQAPQLVVSFQAPGTEHVLSTCVPPELNPNVDGDPTLTAEEVLADCTGRVEATLRGLSAACGYPSACNCTVTATEPPTMWVATCDEPCVGEVVDATCSNFDPENMVTTATHAPGGVPVCITSSPLSAGIFGRQSACEVSGSGTFAGEDETASSAAGGLIEFRGGPCPGQSCEVGIRYQVSLAFVTFGNIFSSRTFRDLRGAGHSLPGLDAVLGVDGTGVFAPGSTQNSARGREGSDALALSGSNGAPLHISLTGGPAPACSLSGELVGAVDPELKRCEGAGPSANQFCDTDDACVDDPACTDGVCNCVQVPSADVTLSLALGGVVVNQPPTTDAGANQVVECNQAGGSRLTLAASTSDPDGNLVQVRWMAGSRVGPEVAQTATAQVQQALGTTTYVNRVIDARGQSDEDFTVVQVRDTKAPQISCNAPPTITPPQPPLSFTSSASDVCDDTVVTEIVAADCYRVNGAGKIIDTTHACRPEITGGTLTVVRSVGVGNHIRWTVRATDASGNVGSRICEVEVVRPGQ